MVTQMTIPEKLNALAECIAKCESVEYSVQATLGDNKEQTLAELRNIVQNGRTLFVSGQIQQLDYDVRQDAFNKWNALLNNKLRLFPEYNKELEEAPVRHM